MSLNHKAPSVVKEPVATSSGFSVIELMVTLSIIVLATGLIMIKYATFNSSTLLTSLAYDMAFDIREAQSLAISVRGRAGEFKQEYGIYFDLNTPNQYVLFQDADERNATGDVRYNSGEEIGDPIVIDPRFTITQICATRGSQAQCDSAAASVAFVRPDFNAVMYAPGFGNQTLDKLEIVVAPVNGDTKRKVVITSSGQISVEN